MSTTKTITIVGGGLAGLALGIGLRRQSVPTTILEAGHYPRHRVCGEFISGRGESTLTQLGLMPLLEKAGARRARTASLFTAGAGSGTRQLPSPALCLSRYRLDEALADEFRRSGGKLEVDTRWDGNREGEGFVDASGRRRARPAVSGDSWFGLKAHFRDMALHADLELHLNPDGYVGLCRLGPNKINVCGVFRTSPRPMPAGAERIELLLALAGPELRPRLRKAMVDESSFCSVAGLSYRRPRFVETHECRIGDCLTLIPPFTGNGMSMAFEAADLAVAPLTRYSRGQLGWEAAAHAVRAACRKRFAQRLACSRLLHSFVFRPMAQRGLGFLIFRFEAPWRLAFARTR